MPESSTTAAPRKIAYLLSNYPTLSMIFVIREVRALRRLGFAIDVASVNAPDRAPDKLSAIEAEEAAGTYYLKSHGILGAISAHLRTLFIHPAGYLRGALCALRMGGLDLYRQFYLAMYFTEAVMVGQWMRRKGQTHLHCHLGQLASTIGLLVKRTFATGYSITVHGPDEFYEAERFFLADKVRAADFICCISHFASSQLKKFSSPEHWNKLVVARLGIDPEEFPFTQRTRNTTTNEILCVGRLVPAKGQHDLLSAVDLLCQRGYHVRLTLAGAGPDELSLRAQTARMSNPDCVEFLGGVNPDKTRALYARADLFCLPSFAEGIPVVLMEAMASGLPCVTTHITGIPELIRNGVDGLLVAPSDVETLAAALAQLLDDQAHSERIAQSARERVTEFYNLEPNVERLASIFCQRINT